MCYHFPPPRNRFDINISLHANIGNFEAKCLNRKGKDILSLLPSFLQSNSTHEEKSQIQIIRLFIFQHSNKSLLRGCRYCIDIYWYIRGFKNSIDKFSFLSIELSSFFYESRQILDCSRRPHSWGNLVGKGKKILTKSFIHEGHFLKSEN